MLGPHANPSEPTDEALMGAYCTGDHEAFQVLFERHAKRIHLLLVRGGAPQQEAHELLQQTFLVVHRARHDFDTSRSFRGWVTTIALNLRRDLARRRRRSPLVPHDPDAMRDPTAAATQEADIRAGEVRDAVQRLPMKAREIIELHWFGGLSMQEVAEAVGTSRSAAKVRAHRAYKQLRTLLGGTA